MLGRQGGVPAGSGGSVGLGWSRVEWREEAGGGGRGGGRGGEAQSERA